MILNTNNNGENNQFSNLTGMKRGFDKKPEDIINERINFESDITQKANDIKLEQSKVQKPIMNAPTFDPKKQIDAMRSVARGNQ